MQCIEIYYFNYHLPLQLYKNFHRYYQEKYPMNFNYIRCYRVTSHLPQYYYELLSTHIYRISIQEKANHQNSHFIILQLGKYYVSLYMSNYFELSRVLVQKSKQFRYHVN